MSDTSRAADEPRMAVRDADLRKLIHAHGAGVGTDLHRALAELQEYRAREEGKEIPEERGYSRIEAP